MIGTDALLHVPPPRTPLTQDVHTVGAGRPLQASRCEGDASPTKVRNDCDSMSSPTRGESNVPWRRFYPPVLQKSANRVPTFKTGVCKSNNNGGDRHLPKQGFCKPKPDG